MAAIIDFPVAADPAGLFAEVHEGTLFLDESGELNKAMQVKRVRVLQGGEVRPVGADRSRKVEVRGHLRHQPQFKRIYPSRQLPAPFHVLFGKPKGVNGNIEP